MATPIYRAGMPAEKQYQFSSITQQIRADNIIVKGRERELDEPTVQKIYESIAEHGLIQPICVRAAKDQPGYDLIVGAHRFEAWLRRWNEGDKNDRTHQRRWGDIPCIVYQGDMTDEQMKLIELRENLERSELTPDQRNEMTAQILEMEAKKTKSSFSVPTQKAVAEMLKVKPSTFKSQFKSYQGDADISVNWTKLTEGQYNGFIQWFRDGKPAPAPTPKAAPRRPQKTAQVQSETITPPDDPEAVEVTFEELADEPGVDPVAEALEEAGVEPLDPNARLPGIHQMPIVALDNKLEGLNTAQKRAVRQFINRKVEQRVYTKVQEGVKEKQVELDNLIHQYGERINGSKEDKRRVIASLHPDRPERSRVKLVEATQAFNRLIGG